MSDELSLRAPAESDWPLISRLANVAVEHLEDVPTQEEWTDARQRFPGWQQHWVARRGEKVLGYGALERRDEEQEGAYRLFVVTAWTGPLEAAVLLYERATEELAGLGATTVWLREYAHDRPLIEFFEERGFAVGEPYRIDGVAMVNLTKRLESARGT